MSSWQILIVVIGLVLSSIAATAHAPYDVPAGDFRRSDGVTVSVFESYVDGILGEDPVTVQFRLPSGEIIAHTASTTDTMVIWKTPTGLEVYNYPTDWIPLATGMQRFDGFSLTPSKEKPGALHSMVIHTRAHLSEYAKVLLIAAVMATAWFAVWKIPGRGWLQLLKVASGIVMLIASALFLLVVLVLAVSPFILGGFVALLVGVAIAVRRLVQRVYC